MLFARTHDFVLGCYIFFLADPAVHLLVVFFEIDTKPRCRSKGNGIRYNGTGQLRSLVEGRMPALNATPKLHENSSTAVVDFKEGVTAWAKPSYFITL